MISNTLLEICFKTTTSTLFYKILFKTALKHCVEVYLNHKKEGKCPRPQSTLQHFSLIAQSNSAILRADVRKYRPEVYKSEKSKILKKIHKVALGKLLT